MSELDRAIGAMERMTRETARRLDAERLLTLDGVAKYAAVSKRTVQADAANDGRGT